MRIDSTKKDLDYYMLMTFVQTFLSGQGIFFVGGSNRVISTTMITSHFINQRFQMTIPSRVAIFCWFPKMHSAGFLHCPQGQKPIRALESCMEGPTSRPFRKLRDLDQQYNKDFFIILLHFGLCKTQEGVPLMLLQSSLCTCKRH